MFKSFFVGMSDISKFTATAVSFFLINSILAIKIEFFSSFQAYIVGFGIGIFCGLAGMYLTSRRPHAWMPEAQVSRAIELVHQMADVPDALVKKVPFEVGVILHLASRDFGTAGPVGSAAGLVPVAPAAAPTPESPAQAQAAPATGLRTNMFQAS